MNELETVLLDIVEAIGVPLLLKLIASKTDANTVAAILNSEYKAAELAAKEAEAKKFGA